jgi:hypothetical protein
MSSISSSLSFSTFSLCSPFLFPPGFLAKPIPVAFRDSITGFIFSSSRTNSLVPIVPFVLLVIFWRRSLKRGHDINRCCVSILPVPHGHMSGSTFRSGSDGVLPQYTPKRALVSLNLRFRRYDGKPWSDRVTPWSLLQPSVNSFRAYIYIHVLVVHVCSHRVFVGSVPVLASLSANSFPGIPWWACVYTVRIFHPWAFRILACLIACRAGSELSLFSHRVSIAAWLSIQIYIFPGVTPL